MKHGHKNRHIVVRNINTGKQTTYAVPDDPRDSVKHKIAVSLAVIVTAASVGLAGYGFVMLAKAAGV